MKKLPVLKSGDRTPYTDLVQTALNRAGFPVTTDGAFGEKTQTAVRRFQATRGLLQDGIVGDNTWNRLAPYLRGYFSYTIRPGQTLWKIAAANGASVDAITAANPQVRPEYLVPGTQLIIPLHFDLFSDKIRVSSAYMHFFASGLSARHPFIQTDSVGQSVSGREIYAMKIGSGAREVFVNASHHANEWITTSLCMKYIESYAKAYAFGGSIYGISAKAMYDRASLYMIPLVNPDGVNLVTGAAEHSPGEYATAKVIAGDFPEIPFTGGWKANIAGTDPNLQYPAGWEQAKEIKYAQGFTKPAPRDFVGPGPLTAPESLAVYNFTLRHNFALTLSYHTQGEVIYWKYDGFEPEGSYDVARLFADVSGYALDLTPAESGNAGYKDWFIASYNRPGYTIECGKGIAPIPLTQLDTIYRQNEGILTLAQVLQ
ncbi:MAG: peptidoglycan-binding protein [Oscillospiraceae bacterium]|jgi:g-D-glutamyl-meso-diaminopimelate peptidase|nr:peptidoglycan-binding protein [Oscillospiraceae bacterium]